MTTKTTGHTPGPWRVEAGGVDKWKIFSGNEYIGVIASCFVPGVRFDADARLVAIAPDLLKTCKRVVCFIRENKTECAIKELETALTAATKET